MSDKAISEKEVAHVAKLAKLQFSDNELSQFSEKLNHVLHLFETLDAVDTTDVEPTYSVTENINVLREDVAEDWKQTTDLVNNAPESKETLIKVPAILEGEG